MLQSLKLAIKSIRSNILRSVLTMLGIIIGVAAVIILISVVSGFTGEMIKQFEDIGANRITINLRNMNTRHIDDDEMYKFVDENSKWISEISPVVSLNGAVIKSNNENLSSTTITGVSEEYLSIMKYQIEEGRNIAYADIAGRSSVCVIGGYVAEEFYGSSDKALDYSIKINGKPFSIIGVIEVQDEDNFEEGGTDDMIIIPYTVATKMNRNGFVNSYLVNSTDTAYTDDITNALKEKFYKVFKNERLYSVFANSSIIKQINSTSAMLTALLGGIAFISLLVAGIGVMNIMLVSVTERTREIGIRKALGARQGVIMLQFIMEALVTTILGGLVGIVIGAIGTKIIAGTMDIEASPTLFAVVISFGVSVAIGLVFGIMPARSAAKLNPIDALRTE